MYSAKINGTNSDNQLSLNHSTHKAAFLQAVKAKKSFAQKKALAK